MLERICIPLQNDSTHGGDVHQNDLESLKTQLYEAILDIRNQTGIPLQSWRSIFDYGSSEWDHISDEQRKAVLKVLESKDGLSLSSLVQTYRAFNGMTGRLERNKSIKFSLSLV
jgi:hypothetical protein